MTESVESRIRELIEREMRAWETGDAELLLTVFHPDMVWPWPRSPTSYDPLDWDIGFGRFDRDRWGTLWQGLFDTHELVHNRHRIRSIQVSEQADAALAVLDVDTLWRGPGGADEHWRGRVSKGYTLVGAEFKLILHTGALRYDDEASRAP